MSPVLTRLDTRRRELGITYPALSKRCGVSVPTLSRTLAGKNNNAGLNIVEAIARALEVDLVCRESVSARSVLKKAATQKAQQLVEMSQATSALEAQAVGEDTLQDLTERTVDVLMAGSKRNIWDE